jgi:hypothetical protein
MMGTARAPQEPGGCCAHLWVVAPNADQQGVDELPDSRVVGVNARNDLHHHTTRGVRGGGGG